MSRRTGKHHHTTGSWYSSVTAFLLLEQMACDEIGGFARGQETISHRLGSFGNQEEVLVAISMKQPSNTLCLSYLLAVIPSLSRLRPVNIARS